MKWLKPRSRGRGRIGKAVLLGAPAGAGRGPRWRSIGREPPVAIGNGGQLRGRAEHGPQFFQGAFVVFAMPAYVANPCRKTRHGDEGPFQDRIIRNRSLPQSAHLAFRTTFGSGYRFLISFVHQTLLLHAIPHPGGRKIPFRQSAGIILYRKAFSVNRAAALRVWFLHSSGPHSEGGQ